MRTQVVGDAANLSIWRLEQECGTKIVYASGAEGCVRAYNIQNRAEHARRHLNSGWVNGLAYSSNLDLVAAATSRGVIQGLRSSTLEPAITMNCLGYWINGVSFIGHTAILVATTAEGEVLLCDLNTGRFSRLPRKHSDQVWSCAVSDCGERAVTTGGNGEVALWNLRKREFEGWVTKGGYVVTSAVFVDNSKILATVDMGGGLTLWSLRDGHARWRFQAHDTRTWSIAKSHCQRRIVTAGADRRACVWDVGSCQLLAAHEADHDLTACLIHDQTGSVIVGDRGGGISVLDDATRISKPPSDGESFVPEVLGTRAIVAFIRGSADKPEDVYSTRVIQALNRFSLDYDWYDIRQLKLVKESLTRMSGHPLFPQVYVNGRFVGGSEIVIEMLESGGFKRLVNRTECAEL